MATRGKSLSFVAACFVGPTSDLPSDLGLLGKLATRGTLFLETFVAFAVLLLGIVLLDDTVDF